MTDDFFRSTFMATRAQAASASEFPKIYAECYGCETPRAAEAELLAPSTPVSRILVGNRSPPLGDLADVAMEVQPNRFHLTAAAASAGDLPARQIKRAPAAVALPSSDSEELREEPAPKRAGGVRESWSPISATQVFREASLTAAPS